MTGPMRIWAAAAVILAAVAGLGYYFAALGLDKADKLASVVGVFAALAGLGVAAYGLLTAVRRHRHEPVMANITGPRDGDHVEHTQAISGIITDVSSPSNVWLVVQPVRAPQYWPQPGPIQPNPAGEFRAVSYFGTSPTTHSGEDFHVFLVIASAEADRTFRTFVDSSPATGLPELPAGAEIAAQRTVIRV